MAGLTGLIGEKVVNGKGEEVEVSTFAGEGKILGIYFSAHWCPPCRAFTPQLADWYKKFKQGANGDNFEVLFVSSDRDEKSFKEYFAEMPWHALPYDKRNKKAELSKKFKVSGIPTLVFVDAENGSLITADGRSIVTDDPEGKDFPWKPKPFSELIQGKFINKEKEETTWELLEGKVVGIYFSAHWCGPCRGFTPQLVKTYNKLKEDNKNFEIIFCSSDRDEDAMMEYLGEMPWLAIPHGDPRKKSLSRLFDVSGIPSLIIIDETGKVITSNGRAAVAGDPDGNEFPWYPKPANELTGATASDLNESASLIWFTDGTPENVDNANSVLTPIAKEYLAKWGDDPKLFFFYTGSDDDELGTSLRQFAQLPSANPLAIVDIPEQFSYTSDETEVTEKTIRDFVEGFLNKTITGKPLRS